MAGGLAVGAPAEEAEEAFETGIGIPVDVLGHGIVHEWEILVAYYTPCVSNLSDVACAFAEI